MSKGDHWNATLYDNHHHFISKYGEAVIDLLAPKENEKILDIGCGTGDLANVLTEKGANVTGIDYSENMIIQAKEKYPDIQFAVADANNLSYKEQFDAVFSNAALHWIKTPEKVIQSVYNSLKPGGRFVAEFGGNGNIKRLLQAIIYQLKVHGYDDAEERNPWYFPTIGQYASLLEKHHFDIVYARMIDRPTKLDGTDGLKKWLQMFTGSFLEGLIETDTIEIITAIEAALKPQQYDGENWTVDYRRIQVVCYKK